MGPARVDQMIQALSLAGLLVALLSANTLRAEDLLQVYQSALQSDPTLRKAEASRLAIREGRHQAVGSLLPQINGQTDYGWEHVSNDTTQPLPPFGQATFVKSTHQENFNWSVELRQTLFRWDQWVRVKQADKELLKADIDYHVAELNLSIRVADGYFTVLSTEATLDAAQAAREAIGRQLDETRQRYEVGFKSPTDVQEAQAAFDRATAAEIRGKRAVANAREALRAITGEFPTSLARPRRDLPLVGPDPPDEDQWVARALEQNYDLQSAQLGAAIARDNIRISQSGHLPQIDLVAAYTDNQANGNVHEYYSLFSGPFLPSNGPLDATNHDSIIAIQLTLPLFSGGVNSSQVREATYQHRAAVDQVEISSRETQRQTRDAYQASTADIAEVRATQQALKSAELALQATEAGVEVGNRNTVDLLNSRQQLFLAQTNYAQSRYTYIVNVLRLKEAAGVLGIKDIETINGWLAQE
jgi:outer membrane protein